MATTTFVANSANDFVNWIDPNIWSTGVVPNDPTIDVIIPTATFVSTGEPFRSTITQTGTHIVGSIAISNNTLRIDGALTVANALNMSTGGQLVLEAGSTLSVGSLQNDGLTVQGTGVINSSGLFLNAGSVGGLGLDLTTAGLTNTGTLGGITLNVTVTPGGFTNLSGSVLTGGSYSAKTDGLYFDVGAVIETAAANIQLDSGGMIYSFDGSGYVPFTSSVHSIAAAGSLSLLETTANWTDLTVDGSVTLSSQLTSLNATHLTVNADGIVSGIGTLGGPILVEGRIVADLDIDLTVADDLTLKITGPVSGSGTLEIGSAVPRFAGRPVPDVFVPYTLELGAAASADVVFQDERGILILGAPSSYSGEITPTGSGDRIVLQGISLSSVSGYSYAGDSLGGSLEIHTTTGEINLDFLGSFTTGSFVLAAGSQTLSGDPPSLVITNTGPASNNDTIVFDFSLVDATVRYVGNAVVIDGPSSQTMLAGSETYVFTDGTVNNNDGSVLIDDLFYYSHNHDVWNAHFDADQHYNQFGWHENRDPNAFFDTSLYLWAYGDVKAAGLNPLTHFDQTGWQEGRVPSRNFDPKQYLAANPDVAAAHVDPLAHFLAFGAAEGRLPFAPTQLIGASGFDFVYYLQHNPDVAAANIDPLAHFQHFGWQEGRNPNALFDTAGYLTTYADVDAAHVNPFDHYNTFGWHEGRDPSVGFDTTSYLAAYPDVAAAGFNPLVHYLLFGQAEGRDAFADGNWG